MKLRPIFFAVVLFLFNFAPVLAFETTTRVKIHTSQAVIPVRVAIAATPEQRAKGLMGVTDLQDDQGMLFVYPKPSHNQFWMKNTPTSLDILFLDEQRRIVFMAKNTIPNSEDIIDPDQATQFVLEVKAGFSEMFRLAIGDHVSW